MGAICVSGGGPGFDLDQAAAENREFLSTRTSEKQEMILLNDRLAAYIEKASAQLNKMNMPLVQFETLALRSHIQSFGSTFIHKKNLPFN